MIKKILEKRRRKFVSMLTKSIIAFLCLCLIPFLFIGFAIYNSYVSSVKDSYLENLYQRTVYVGKNCSDIFEEMNENSKYIYKYNITEYHYFYELIEDKTISESQRQSQITDVLRLILYKNRYINHVMFITKDGKQYSCMRPPEIMLNKNTLQAFHEEHYKPEDRGYQIIATHLTNYYYYSKLYDFSISRNIMNTRTIQTAQDDVIGTIYLDVSNQYLKDIIEETNFGDNHEVMIIDKRKQNFVYCTEDYDIGLKAGSVEEWIPYMVPENTYLKTSDSYLVYSTVPDTDWIIIDKIAISDVESSFHSMRNTTFLILGLGILVLGAIYLYYSKTTNQPIRKLQNAMKQIQKGDLDVRIPIYSNDEIGTVAEGVNEMVKSLQHHIQRVYVAELNQKTMELDALKSQIQPHYLYNTLDVIRMTALTNDDMVTAQMLENLSSQLKYLIGAKEDKVPLRAEIENIKNYFNLIRIRFENRFELEVVLPKEVEEAIIPRLILQPAVENAVNHGLRPKAGRGRVEISAEKSGNLLEITVMDDGVGFTQERVDELYALLESSEPGKRTGSTWESIGLKNVYDRIKIIYGEDYGITISSYEGIGTIIKYTMPVIIGEN